MEIEETDLPNNPQNPLGNVHIPEKCSKNCVDYSENSNGQYDATFSAKNDSCNVINDTCVNFDDCKVNNDSCGGFDISNVNNGNSNVKDKSDSYVSTIINDTHDVSSDDKLSNVNGSPNVKAKSEGCISTIVNDTHDSSSDHEPSINVNSSPNVKAKSDFTATNDTHDSSSDYEPSTNVNGSLNIKASSDHKLSTNVNGIPNVKAKSDFTVTNDTHDSCSDHEPSTNVNGSPNVKAKSSSCVSTIVTDTHDSSSDHEPSTNVNGSPNVKANSDSCVSTIVNDTHDSSSDYEPSTNVNSSPNTEAKSDFTATNGTRDSSSDHEVSTNVSGSPNVKAKSDSCVSTIVTDTHDSSSDHEPSTNANGSLNVEAKSHFTVTNDTHDDSSDDEVPRKRKLSLSDDDSGERMIPRKKMARLIDSESELEASVGGSDDDCIGGSRMEEPIYGERVGKSRLSALCDSDSSDEEVDANHDVRLEASESSNNRKKEPPPEKPKKMTNKEAMEQRMEIESESQRRLRERQVSLPYHKPKQRTLREFLSKRSKFASALPIETARDPPAIAIKMSTQHLKVITERMRQREKEVKEFFKSDSEVSDDEAVEETSEAKDDEVEVKDPEDEIIEENKEIIEENQEKTEDKIAEGNLNEVVTSEIFNPEIPAENEPSKASDIEPQILSQNELSEPQNEMSASQNGQSEPQNGQSEPQNGQSEAQNGESEPLNGQSEAQNGESDPLNGQSEPQNGQSEPQNGQSEPQNELSRSRNELSVPQNELSEPQNELSEPQNEPSTSSKPQTDMDYSFNLNDSDELEAKISDSSQDPEPQMTELEISEAPRQSEISEPPQNPQLSRKAKLLASLKDTMPKLSGGPNLLIDLERGVTKPDKVTELMQRFAQHTSKRKTPQKNKIQVSIVSVSGGGEIHKEQLAVNVLDKEAPPINEKPGLMLQKLKSELESQMALRRTELWRQKQNSVKNAVEDHEMSTFEGETCAVDEDDILDNEDEEDLTESEEEMEEDEDEVEEEKPKYFADEEAEEENDDEDEEQSEDEAPSEDDSSCQSNVKAKQLKRIIKPCEDDSDENDTLPNDVLESDTGDDDDCPPAGQSSNHRTPKRNQETSKSDLNFLTPVCHLTGLQAPGGIDESFLQQGSCTPEILPPDEPSPLKGNWQKKLFADTDIIPTQHTFVDDLSENGSGVFQTTEVTDDILTSPVKLPEVEVPSTQELMDLCSGKFTSVGSTQRELSNEIVENVTLGQSEIKNFDSDNDDKFISQLIDEQEMEEFKKKFESPVKSCQLPASSGIPAKTTFQSSDEEDEVETTLQKKKKRNVIIDSDEESEGEEPEETINLHDQDEEEEELEPSKEVDYDSEENEIELVDKQTDGKGGKLKACDFFEEEAELSESEWGSEDEDEGGLDILDTEQGDSEKFDEDKVRTEIEKLHMRQILDDDNREVKILQELLLEDGELHGAGRQRQFRWKNIDSQMNDSEGRNVEDGENQPVEEEDEDDELEWRRKRHERELFLRKNSQGSQERVPVDCDLTLSTDSQVIKLGQKAIIRNNSQPGKVEPVKSVINVKQSFSLLNKRGSFLTRTDKVLARVAEFTKIQEMTVGGAKKSRNFVFQSVNPSEASTSSLDKKRKAQRDGTPLAIKKMRLNALSPALQKKTDKNMKKKLFGGGAGW